LSDGLLWIYVLGTDFDNGWSHNFFPHPTSDGSGFVWSPDGPPPQTEHRTCRRLTDDGWYAWTYEHD